RAELKLGFSFVYPWMNPIHESGRKVMSFEVQIREATTDDVAHLVRHRRLMYEDMGYNDPGDLSNMIATCEPYLAKALANGTLRGWLACAGDRVVAGGAILISPWPSHPYD